MELKPMKGKNVALYPTIKEVPKFSFIKEILLTVAIAPTHLYPVSLICYIAVPSYMSQIKTCKLIRSIFIGITILSSILLFVNKVKINKCISETEMAEKLRKLKKHRKIKWWIWGISIAIVLITSIVILYLENL